MTTRTGYAGIEKRFAALLIDGIILNIIGFIIVGRSPAELKPDAKLATYLILMQIIAWIYYAFLESCSMQGTLGKRVVGIIVTNLQGNQISFGKATARYFAKSICIVFWIVAVLLAAMTPSKAGSESPYPYLSIALFVIGLVIFIVGYLMAAYTPEKQALHDIMARCYVVNGRGQSNSITWKPLVGLAIAVLVSKGIVAQVPSSPPETKPPETKQSTPPETKPPENQIFGELTPVSSSVYSQTNGVWKLEFAAGITQHQAILSMSGDSGFMVVQLPNGQGGIQRISQTMRLWQSYQGLVIAGKDPTDIDTKKSSETYAPDNFIITISPSQSNKVTFRNISVNLDNDKSIVTSPVNATFLGYPRIGIKMIELSSKLREQFNQDGNFPFSINQDTGVIITEVNKNSPAAKAHLRPGDIIQSINGNTVTRTSEVQSQITSSLLSVPLNFEINRGGENLSVEVRPECCVTPEELKQQQSPEPKK